MFKAFLSKDFYVGAANESSSYVTHTYENAKVYQNMQNTQ